MNLRPWKEALQTATTALSLLTIPVQVHCCQWAEADYQLHDRKEIQAIQLCKDVVGRRKCNWIDCTEEKNEAVSVPPSKFRGRYIGKLKSVWYCSVMGQNHTFILLLVGRLQPSEDRDCPWLDSVEISHLTSKYWNTSLKVTDSRELVNREYDENWLTSHLQ